MCHKRISICNDVSFETWRIVCVCKNKDPARFPGLDRPLSVAISNREENDAAPADTRAMGPSLSMYTGTVQSAEAESTLCLSTCPTTVSHNIYLRTSSFAKLQSTECVQHGDMVVSVIVRIPHALCVYQCRRCKPRADHCILSINK